MPIGRCSWAMLLVGILSASDARADEQATPTPLMIYTGNSHAAQIRVRRATEEAIDGVDGRTLPDLITDDAPYFVGIETAATCQGPSTTNEQVLKQVVDAHELRVNMDLAGAAELLDAAADSLECLSQPLESTTGARVHFLLGILHFAGGDEDAARDAFDQALRFRPDLSWDDDFAPDARPVFSAVQTAAGARPAAMLHLVAGTVDQVRIDGRVPDERDGVLDVSAGPHVVQVIGEAVDTMVVDLPVDTTTWLIIPRAVDDALLDLVLTPEGRAALEGIVLGSSAGERAVVFVAHPAETWRYDPQGRAWQQLQVDVGRSVRTPLLIGGGVATALGGVLMAVHATKAHRLESEVEDDQARASPTLTTTGHREREDRWKRARTGYWVGTGIGATGVIAAALGGVLFLDVPAGPVRLLASPLPGGGVMHLQISPFDKPASKRRKP